MPRLLQVVLFIFPAFPVLAQTESLIFRTYQDSMTLSNGIVKVVIHQNSGKVDYRFQTGASMDNTVAYVEDIHAGLLKSSDFGQHRATITPIRDSLGRGQQIRLVHKDARRPLSLLQTIRMYEGQPFLLTDVEAQADTEKDPAFLAETRNISPLAILPSENSRLFIPGKEPRILDVPFDNDDWVDVLEQKWPAAPAVKVSGISYELSSVYDNETKMGIVLGSVEHDFWKTGIVYRTGAAPGLVDSFKVFGGVATRDMPSLPAAYGGRDGTHDYEPHGTALGKSVRSPLLYICGLRDVRMAFTGYGEMNSRLNGRLSWKGFAPVYWNSFGVEGVLGYQGVMMPEGVYKVSDFIHSLDHFNGYGKPVLSIDSYDQSIYSTDVLAAIARYGENQHQQMGFYFIPFAVWTWKNSFEQGKLSGTDYLLRDVLLRDKDHHVIPYKDGDWGAYPLDVTHPAVRQLIIGQLQKAKAIHARFIKIDFLTAGALESPMRYDPSVRSGMQAYNQAMKMLKHLVDSIMGPDVFITQAISPLFPHQYAHTRFISTDVYSHLRDDQPGFPNWGSTEASLATGSHMWWVQGTLWPFTNLDVSIMKSFQKNPDLTEQEIKVRIYALMVMGSILGDGSDLRHPLAAERALKFLNNEAVCKFFSNPKAFTPLRFSDGPSLDQQLVFHLKGDPSLLALFNFSKQQPFKADFTRQELGLGEGEFIIRDFMTDAIVSKLEKNQTSFSLGVAEKDALLIKLVPVHD